MKLTKLVLHFYLFSTIFYGFSKLYAIWSIKDYSPESMIVQKTPWNCLNCCTRSFTRIGGEEALRELDLGKRRPCWRLGSGGEARGHHLQQI